MKTKITKILTKLMKLSLAMILAFFVVNILVFFYQRPVGYLNTPNGASLGIRKPGSIIVNGQEGYGVSVIDKNGYTNDHEIGDKYILIVGSSHSQGKEISSNKKYSELVNDYLISEGSDLTTYNISCDSYFLPQIIKQFKNIIKAYPNSECIVIEIVDTDYTINDLADSLNQCTEYDNTSAEDQFANLSVKDKTKNFIKEYFPLISIIRSNYIVYGSNQVTSEIDVNKYKSVFNDCLSLIRNEYDGEILFIYHPRTSIESDGTITLIKSKTIDVFKESCDANNIDFIDLGDDFVNEYEDTYLLPYGFMNTTIGSGHLNETGHKILANRIIEYLEDMN